MCKMLIFPIIFFVQSVQAEKIVVSKLDTKGYGMTVAEDKWTAVDMGGKTGLRNCVSACGNCWLIDYNPNETDICRKFTGINIRITPWIVGPRTTKMIMANPEPEKLLITRILIGFKAGVGTAPEPGTIETDVCQKYRAASGEVIEECCTYEGTSGNSAECAKMYMRPFQWTESPRLFVTYKGDGYVALSGTSLYANKITCSSSGTNIQSGARVSFSPRVYLWSLA